MSLIDNINDAWKAAMKAGNPTKDTLSAIRAEVKNKVINSRPGFTAGEMVVAGGAPSDELVLEALGKMAKQRRESVTEFEKGGRDDLVAAERAELAVIESFMPQQMTNEAIAEVVKATIAELGATTAKDTGRVMKAVMEKVKGVADGKTVQAAVKSLLV
jgi:uncharacterized protein YqeY